MVKYYLVVVVVFCFGFAQFFFWDRLSLLNSVGGDLLGVVLYIYIYTYYMKLCIL